MIQVTLRFPDELHEKLRWVCYRKRKSQQVILVEIVEKALAKVEVPDLDGLDGDGSQDGTDEEATE